jgi:hypothetical protein
MKRVSARRTGKCAYGPEKAPGRANQQTSDNNNAYLFGAICPARGTGAALMLP